MDTAHIAQLLKPFLRMPGTASSCHSEPGQRPGEEPAVLSPAQLQSISTYIDILLRWNARINLTAIRSPEEIVTRHFGENLFAARHLFPQPMSLQKIREGHGFSRAETSTEKGWALAPDGIVGEQRSAPSDRVSVADVGSGAGFPGVPIKLWAPHISLTLIESNHKKAAFLREITRALTLTDVNIQNTRAELLTPFAYDVVTLRAVERFESILPTAAALVAPGGRLALLISSAQQAQARSALPDLAWSDPAPVPQSRSRILLVACRPLEA